MLDSDGDYLARLEKNLNQLYSYYFINAISDYEYAQKLVSSIEYDVIICGNGAKVSEGIKFLRFLRNSGCESIVILLSESPDEKTIAESLRYRADDFIIKKESSDFYYNLHEVILNAVQRKIPEMEQEKSITLFSETYEHLPIGVINLSTDNTIIHTNSLFASWLRVKTPFHPNTNLKDLVISSDRKKIEKLLSPSENADSQRGVIRFVGPDDNILLFKVTVTFVYREDHVKAARNIIRKVLTLEKVDSYKTELESVETLNLSDYLETLPFIGYQLNKRGQLSFVNHLGEKYFGIDFQAQKGKSIFTLFDPDSAKKGRKSFKDVLDGEVRSVELRLKSSSRVSEHRMFPLYSGDGYIDGANCLAFDITEKRRSEQKLERSERRYHSLVDNAHAGICLVDSNENIFFCNPAFASNLKYETSDLIGENLSSIMSEAEFKKVQEESRKRRDGKPGRYHIELLTKEGEKRHYIISTSGLFGDNHKMEAIIGILTDITEQHKLSDNLSEVNRQLSFLQEVMEITHGEDNFEDIFNKTSELILEHTGFKGAAFYRNRPEAGKEKPEFIYNPSKLKKASINILDFNDSEIKKLLKKEDVIKHPALSNSLLINLIAENESLGLLALIENAEIDSLFDSDRSVLISSAREIANGMKRIQYQDALEEAYQNYRYLYESALTAIYRTSIIDGTFLEANQSMAELLGFDTPEELITECKATNLYPEGDRQDFLDTLRREHEIKGHEVRIMRPDGRELDILINARLFREQGYIEGTITDITRQKKLEKELLRKNEEMEAFIYTVSHDLKSPLFTIDGYANLLNEESISREDQDKFVSKIRKNVESMSVFISRLLELSRSGQIVEAASTIPVQSFLNEFIKDIKMQYPNVNFICNNIPESIQASSRIKEVFQNLILNAVEASTEVTIPTVELTAFKNPSHWDFRVEDNGRGMTRWQLEKIYNPGFSTKTGKKSGSGFGLSISKRIVEAHGGALFIDSEEDKGTTCMFTIPFEFESFFS